MIRRALRLGGLGGDRVRERIEAALVGCDLGDEDAAGLLALVDPEARGARPFGGPEELFHAVSGFVRRQAADRPVIWLVDEAHWATDGLGAISALLQKPGGRHHGVLVVLCTTDEALAERPVERHMLFSLMQEEGAGSLEIGPLTSAEGHALVRALLGLDSALARRVAERTAGNPMFAVQLVGDWVQRGILQPGPDGFTLREGAEAPLPDSLFAVWSDRVDAALDELPKSDRLALEIAALLGNRVPDREWRAACRARGLEPSDGLLGSLVDRSLATREPGSDDWSFAHSVLREALERQAEEGGRAASHHRACAAMLQATERPSGGRAAERLARHLHRAEAPEQVLEPALDALEHALRQGLYDRADALLSLWSEAKSALLLSDDDPRWIRGWTAAASVHLARGRARPLLEALGRLERGVAQHDWPASVLGFVRLQQGILARRAGDHLRALDRFREARDGLAPELEGTLQAQIGLTLQRLGALADAEAALQSSLEHAGTQGDDALASVAWIGLGGVALHRGDLERAEECANRARHAARAARWQVGAAEVAELLGRVALRRGESEEAVRWLRTCVTAWERLGAAWAALSAQVHLVLTQAPMTAGSALETLSAAAHAQANRAIWVLIRLGQLWVHAETGDAVAFDRHLQDVTDGLADTGLRSSDVAELAERAGLAAAKRWPERATGVLVLAAHQWKGLGRHDQADRILRSLA